MSIIQEGHVDVQTENNIATIEFGHPMSNSLPSKILKLFGRLHTLVYSLLNDISLLGSFTRF